jgi:predicted MFS family arabinose efflux permease
LRPLSSLAVDRGRIGVAAAFLSHSVLSGTFASRIPAIKHDLGLSDAQLGVALFGMALGTIAGGRLGGLAAFRVGPAIMVRIGVPAGAAALCLIGLAGDLGVLAAVLVANGVVAAAVDVSMNAEAVVVERDHGRPLMSGFHGMWSVGLGVGALIGVAAADAGMPPSLHFAVVAVAVVAASAVPLARLPRRAAALTGRSRVDDRWTLAVVVLGLLALCSFVCEGAAIDWSAVFLHDRAEAGPALAVAGFASFSLGMIAARLLADRMAAAVGPVRLVAVSTSLAASGLALALLLPTPATGLIGFGLLGLGLGPVVPTVVSAAAGAGLGPDESVVSRVFTVGYLGAVSGPALIGLVAGQVGLRAALVIPLVLVLAISASSGRLRTAAGH